MKRVVFYNGDKIDFVVYENVGNKLESRNFDYEIDDDFVRLVEYMYQLLRRSNSNHVEDD